MRRFWILFAVLCATATAAAAQGVGVNTPVPDASAALHVSSPDSARGFLMPRLYTPQRDAIASPAPGLMIYNLTTNCINLYNGQNWIEFCSSTAPCTPPATPIPGSNGPICGCTPLQLTVNPTAGATYYWIGPNGFVSNLQNPSIATPTAANAGTYTVRVTVGGCYADSSITVTTAAPPAMASIPGQALWLRADAGITMDGANRVSVWQDQSGNGRHATQGTAGNQPVWAGGVIGGQAAVSFDGTNDFITSPNVLPSLSEGSFFVVLRLNPGATTVRWVFEQNPGTSHLALEGCGNLNARFYIGGVGGSGQPLVPGTPALLSGVAGGGTMAVHLNGTTCGTPAAYAGNTSNQPFIIAARPSATGCAGPYYMWGHIAELIVYNRALTCAERTAVEDYLKGKYGL